MQLTEEPGNTLNLWPETLFSLGTKALYSLRLWSAVSCRLWLFHYALMPYIWHNRVLFSFVIISAKGASNYGYTSAIIQFFSQISLHSLRLLTIASYITENTARCVQEYKFYHVSFWFINIQMFQCNIWKLHLEITTKILNLSLSSLLHTHKKITLVYAIKWTCLTEDLTVPSFVWPLDPTAMVYPRHWTYPEQNDDTFLFVNSHQQILL